MTVTARVGWAIGAAVLGALLALGALAHALREEAFEARLSDTVTAAMEASRARCEADPAAFVARRPTRPPRGPRAPRGGRGERRVERVRPGRTQAVFAADGRASSGGPPLDPEALATLQAHATVPLDGPGVPPDTYAVRMPWDEGPCAIVQVRAPRPHPGAFAALRPLSIAGVVLLVALLAAVLALRGPLVRLRALTRAAEELARSGFSRRGALDEAAPAPNPSRPGARDEVEALGAALRLAVDRIAADAAALSARDAALTEYVAHTTHDLLTPVTVLTGQLAELQAALAAHAPVDPALVAHAMGEAHHLTQLVQNLGIVARLDRPTPIVQRHPLDLRDVVARVAARHAPLARARGLSLEHAVPAQPVPFEGDGLLLERALGNLVHNALRHPRREGRTGGHVAVVLTASGGGFALRVLDDGDGMTDAGLEALRSGVPTDARTRTVGFGLDVVRRVADLHGLRLDVEHGQDGGLTFTLHAAASGPPRPLAAVGPA